MGQLRVTLFLSAIFFPYFTAEGTEQYLGGQIKDSKTFEEMYKDFDSKEFRPTQLPGYDEDKQVRPLYKPDRLEKLVNEKQTIKKTGQGISGVNNPGPEYVSKTNRDIYRQYEYSSNYIFSFTLMKDTFDYESQNDYFEKVFRDSESSPEFPAIIRFSFDRYIFRTFAEMTLNFQVGLGYNKGNARFADADNSVSERTGLFLWTLPIDLGLSLELPLYNWVKLSGVFGGSAMALLQNRTDFSSEDSGKYKRQMGYGVYGEGRVKINLSKIFAADGRDLFEQFDITGMYMNFVTRFNSYSGFKNENLSVGGLSYGIGFSFDYL